jgi:hypothetical protein
MIDLFAKYPLLIILLVLIILTIIIIALVSLFRDREFEIPWLKFGKKSDNQKNIQQTVFQNLINTGSLALSEEQIDSLVNRIVKGVNETNQGSQIEMQTEQNIIQGLPEGINFILASRYSIERIVRGMVLKAYGGWAGCSIASFDNYMVIAVDHKMISEELKNEIDNYFVVADMLINIGDVPGHRLVEMQLLASSINYKLREIDKTIPSMYGQ